MAEPRTDFLMAQLRKSRGLSLEKVAAVVGTDQANLSRVEKGQQIPKRELARSLYRYYQGQVPLSAIYDPEFYAGEG
jgi:transcriptional regulator with XRE-family HTH domain